MTSSPLKMCNARSRLSPHIEVTSCGSKQLQPYSPPKSRLRITRKPTFSYKRWIYNTKILVTKRATQSLIPVAKSLYASLIFGNKTYTSSCYESIKEQFRRWGLSHYLARSGLHLGANRCSLGLVFQNYPNSFYI